MKNNNYVANFNDVAYPVIWNWEADHQPRIYEQPADYIKMAKDLKRPILTFVAQTLTKAGYALPQDQKKLVALLMALPDKETLDLGGVKVKWRIKSEQSVLDKMAKDKKTADHIGDYFGVKLIAKGVHDVAKLRNAVIDSRSMTSRKCEFTVPSGRGYRSHKSHHAIKGLSTEIMIAHEGFECIEQLTHSMIERERILLRQEMSAECPNIRAHFCAMAKDSKKERTILNQLVAKAVGLNALCADPSNYQLPDNISQHDVKSILSALEATSGTIRTLAKNSGNDNEAVSFTHHHG